MSVSTDRWTCAHPSCPTPTVVIVGSPADTHCCIEAAQLRHAAAHRHAADVLSRLGLPDPPPIPRPRRAPARDRAQDTAP